jgi:hypothetical protein
MIASPRGLCRAGLSAPPSAAAAPLIGGGKLPFLALGLFSLAVLTPAPDRLGAASHLEMSVTTYSTTSTLQPGREPHSTARRSTGAQTETPKPADLAVLGLRTPRRFHRHTIAANAERKRPRQMESPAEWTRAKPSSLSQFQQKTTGFPRAGGPSRHDLQLLQQLSLPWYQREASRRRPCWAKASGESSAG